MYWLLVGLVRSLKSTHRAQRILLLCEDNNDLTSPTSNHIQDIHTAVSIVFDTKSFEKIFFEHSCSYYLIRHFNCEIKMGVLLL